MSDIIWKLSRYIWQSSQISRETPQILWNKQLKMKLYEILRKTSNFRSHINLFKGNIEMIKIVFIWVEKTKNSETLFTQFLDGIPINQFKMSDSANRLLLKRTTIFIDSKSGWTALLTAIAVYFRRIDQKNAINIWNCHKPMLRTFGQTYVN